MRKTIIGRQVVGLIPVVLAKRCASTNRAAGGIAGQVPGSDPALNLSFGATTFSLNPNFKFFTITIAYL